MTDIFQFMITVPAKFSCCIVEYCIVCIIIIKSINFSISIHATLFVVHPSFTGIAHYKMGDHLIEINWLNGYHTSCCLILSNFSKFPMIVVNIFIILKTVLNPTERREHYRKIYTIIHEDIYYVNRNTNLIQLKFSQLLTIDTDRWC